MMCKFNFYDSNYLIKISGNLLRSIYLTKNFNVSVDNYFVFLFSAEMINYKLKLKSRDWNSNLVRVESEDYMDLEETIKKEVISFTAILVCFITYESINADASSDRVAPMPVYAQSNFLKISKMVHVWNAYTKVSMQEGSL